MPGTRDAQVPSPESCGKHFPLSLARECNDVCLLRPEGVCPRRISLIYDITSATVFAVELTIANNG